MNSKPKITVITASIRPKGLEVTRKCLMEQTFTDFEWIVDINWTGNHDLNAAYNRMLCRANGELIVSLQDHIKVTPDYLQRFWDAYQKYPNTFFTAPVGKVSTEDFSGSAKWDWRAYKRPETEDAIEATWDCWEIDSASAPLEALKKIGGFDEAIDGHWSCDNVNVGCRAELEGYKFMNLFSNPAVAFDHDAFEPHPFRANFRPIFNNMRMEEFRNGKRLDALK